MNILMVCNEPNIDVLNAWIQAGVNPVFASSRQLISDIQKGPSRYGLIDSVVIISDEPALDDSESLVNRLEPGSAIILGSELLNLNDEVALVDGRKWNSIPQLVLVPSAGEVEATGARDRIEAELGTVIQFEVADRESAYSIDSIRENVRMYRQALLSEMDNLGFVIRYEAGRYRIGPALKSRHELSSRLYHGPADKRSSEFVTLDRDNFQLQREVEEFESLINRKDVAESSLQDFFEQNPHFLSTSSIPIAQPQLAHYSGRILIPDFVMRPLVAEERDSRWEVLDLKLPQAPLLVGPAHRRRLSHHVMGAIRQLRDYGNYFEDARHEDQVEAAVGRKLRKPKLGVLIGRLVPGSEEDLEREQRSQDVRLVTYDEILEQQKQLVDAGLS